MVTVSVLAKDTPSSLTGGMGRDLGSACALWGRGGLFSEPEETEETRGRGGGKEGLTHLLLLSFNQETTREPALCSRKRISHDDLPPSRVLGVAFVCPSVRPPSAGSCPVLLCPGQCRGNCAGALTLPVPTQLCQGEPGTGPLLTRPLVAVSTNSAWAAVGS